MKKSYIFFLTIAVLFLTTRSRAAPVFGEVFDVHQPDGALIKVRIWGDEFYQVFESLDGYTLVRDPKSKEICYAELSADENELVSTGISASRPLPDNLEIKRHIRINKQAARAQIRTSRSRFDARVTGIPSASLAASVQFPCNGNVKGICLIVDFPDEPYSIAPSDVYDFCNKVGYDKNGNNGSVHDYFYDVSGTNLNYTNYVPQIYYRAQRNKTYYDDPYETYGIRASELVIEALIWLDNQGFDFSKYDSNNDGWIDAINCFYAGSAVPGGGLWPHQCVIQANFTADGVSSYNYQISDMGSELTLGTFCHENGHLICGWPDLYDLDWDGYQSDSSGIGDYCLMSHGIRFETNPVEPCAYLKDLAGWATVTTLSSPEPELDITAGINRFFKYPHPRMSNEFFIISSRQQTGRDANLPDSGLAIWYIDTNGCNDNQQMTPELHYEVTLLQADGLYDLEYNRNSGDDTDLFDGLLFNQCTPFTNPNTNWWNGSLSAMHINNIKQSSDTMLFAFDITYPIEQIITLASSQAEDQGPENTINGSGLVDEFHSNDPTTMWLTDTSESEPAWIRYEFDKDYKLNKMLVWNYNEGLTHSGFGLKDVSIEYSLDNIGWIKLVGASQFAKATGTSDYLCDTNVDFDGIIAKSVRITANSNWSSDVSNQYGLSEVRFLRIPMRAREPSPDIGAADVDPDVILDWAAGREAAEHKVYLSTDKQAVTNGTALIDTVSQTGCGPLSLNSGTTYYWRIDEVNKAQDHATWQGNIWSFSTGNYIVVDDFENYSAYWPNTIDNTWMDGWGTLFNGSIIYSETQVAHRGQQSMLIIYDNSSTSYSEATVDTNYLAIGRDWTIAGPQMLSLWFHGYPGNSTTEQMYIKLNGSKVVYDGDPDNMAREQWQKWDIDLAAFGVNLRNVSTFSIGFEKTGATGGFGWIFIDDIRLYIH